ncbi:Neural-cadherin, partial [Armadillidium nasatum]
MVVQAVDKDTSPEFRTDPPPHVRDNFRIDPSTGEIWNIKKLDRETEKQYRIPVQVTDGKNVRDRQYWIIVNDQNDEPPKFNLETGIYETEVEEDLTVGKGTGIRLVIISGNEASKFHINSETGVISVNKELDYDAPINDRNFTMEVRVSDGLRYDTTVVKISVINVNDISPAFLPVEYSVTVLENEECDKVIISVYAYDPDYPSTGDIEYSLSRAEQSNFTIDAKEGSIRVKGCLDRESTPRGTMNIFPIAFDEGGDGKNSEPSSVQIFIKDVNDNHPYIESPPDKYAQFMENVAPQNISNVVVIRLNDYDNATEGNGCPCTLAFDQSTPTNVFESFDVIKMEDENQYQLVTKKTLDREAQKFYVIPFLTTDNKGFSGIRTLTVEVGDQNDSPMSDGESKILVYNYMSSFPSIVIGSVYVTDADDYDVDDKTFEFDPSTPSEDQQFFEINFNTGNITMKRGTGAGDYTLVVQVTDNVRKEKAKGTIHITVIDLPKEAVMESGSFLIQDRSVRDVISQRNLNVYEGTSLYDGLKEELGNIFAVASQNVDIFHLVDTEKSEFKGVEVRFNVHGSPYYTSSHVNGILMQHKNEIESNLQIRIPVVDDNMCLYEDSLRCNGTSCQQELRVDKNKPLVLSGYTSTIVGVKITEEYTCKCGNLDPQPRACPEGYENYCFNGGTCNYTSSGGLTCSCLDDINYGPRCELMTGRFKGGFAWFDSLGTCEEPTLRLTFQSENPSAVLLYNGPIVASPYNYYPKDFLYIVLNNWVVEAYLNLGSETSRVYVPIEPTSFEAFDIFLSWTTNTIEMVIPNCGMNNTIESSEACKRTYIKFQMIKFKIIKYQTKLHSLQFKRYKLKNKLNKKGKKKNIFHIDGCKVRCGPRWSFAVTINGQITCKIVISKMKSLRERENTHSLKSQTVKNLNIVWLFEITRDEILKRGDLKHIRITFFMTEIKLIFIWERSTRDIQILMMSAIIVFEGDEMSIASLSSLGSEILKINVSKFCLCSEEESYHM